MVVVQCNLCQTYRGFGTRPAVSCLPLRVLTIYFLWLTGYLCVFKSEPLGLRMGLEPQPLCTYGVSCLCRTQLGPSRDLGFPRLWPPSAGRWLLFVSACRIFCQAFRLIGLKGWSHAPLPVVMPQFSGACWACGPFRATALPTASSLSPSRPYIRRPYLLR